MEIEERINQKLKEAGIVRDILTPKEIEQLKQEIKIEDEGGGYLDGVLSNPNLLYSRMYEYNKRKNSKEN